MQLTDKDGNVFGIGGLEITTSDGKPKIPVINTDITIGTTTIVGGAVNRILFQGIGNVVQESSSFTYDDTLKKFTLTGPIGSVIQHTVLTNYNGLGGFQLNVADGTERAFLKLNPTTGEVRIGATGSGYFPTFYAQGVEAMRIFASTRNVGINTTTDAGYKADINGTLRLQSSLILLNPAFTLGGSITHSANATLVIAGGPGGGENITIGPSNRIFINAQQSRFPNGSVQIAGTLSVGSPNASSVNMLWVTGGITASSSIARGISLETTLAQSAANDVLTAVNIAPTFTVNNTLFHNVYWMRFTGSYTPASFTGNNNAATIDLSNSFTNTNNAIGIRIRHTYSNVQNGYGLLIESGGFIGIAQTSTTSRNFFAGTTVIGSSVVAPAAGYTLHVTNNTNGAIKIGTPDTSNEHLIISHSQAGATFSSIRNTFASAGSQMLIDVAGQGNLRLFGTGNVGVKTTVDAGYTFDVNGTARVTTRIDAGTFTPGAGASAYTIATAGRISAGNGISFRSPIVGDSDFTGFVGAGIGIQVFHNNASPFSFGGSGGALTTIALATPNFNPSSGTGDKAIFQVAGTYQTSGTYSGAIRGFYYNPTLTSMTGVTAHWAFHSTSGRIRFENLPTSPAGLSSGDVWNNLGILTIV